MPEHDTTYTKWHTALVRAVCTDDACPWKYRGHTQGATVSAAKRHAAQTGHDVWLERTQHRWTLVVRDES